MFDILKILIEKFLNLIDPRVLAELKRKKKLREIGQSLFGIYLNLTELVASGNRLVESLEGYVWRMSSDLRENRSTEHAKNWGRSYIAALVVQQSYHLNRLSSAMANYSEHFYLIDPRTTRELDFLLRLKMGTLLYITRVMEEKKLLLECPTYEEIRARVDALKPHPTKEHLTGFFHAYDREGMDFAMTLNQKIHDGAVDATSPWQEETLDRISAYLKTRQPHETLKLLADACDQLRHSLLEHFSLEDVLLDSHAHSNSKAVE